MTRRLMNDAGLPWRLLLQPARPGAPGRSVDCAARNVLRSKLCFVDHGVPMSPRAPFANVLLEAAQAAPGGGTR
jgi:hypothetical protein